MNGILKLIFPCLIFLCFSECQMKDLDLELVETACKNFKISNAIPSWPSNTDPSCSGAPLNASFQVTFSYDGKKECIDHLDLSPKFYRADNSEISGIDFINVMKKSDPDISIGSNSVTFTFRFTFQDATHATSINHILLKLHVENELDNESNKLELRLNANCSTVPSSTYKVKEIVNVSSKTVQVTLFDDAAEDGDIVSVYLNGAWELENYTLKKAGETFTWTINSGSNDLVLFAVNEGSSGPNTCAISINGGSNISLSPDLLTGEAINIKF
jgi:hypothetical protein